MTWGGLKPSRREKKKKVCVREEVFWKVVANHLRLAEGPTLRKGSRKNPKRDMGQEDRKKEGGQEMDIVPSEGLPKGFFQRMKKKIKRRNSGGYSRTDSERGCVKEKRPFALGGRTNDLI